MYIFEINLVSLRIFKHKKLKDTYNSVIILKFS